MAKTDATSSPVITAGRLHRQRQRRIRNAAHAVLALALAVLLFAALRPLPVPPAASAPVLPAVAPLPSDADPVETRERRLADLARSGNVFAPDRLAWEEDEIETAAVDPDDQPDPADLAPVSPGAAKPGLGPIRLTERPTAAATKSRDALDLVGVYVSGERRFAMIRGGEPDRKKDVELYSEDDVFYGETWRLLRVVPEHDRVILEHLGQGDILALSMYDYEIPSVAAVEDEPTLDPTIAAREEMLDAGVAEEDVEDVFELLAALERGEDIAEGEPEAEPAESDEVASNEQPNAKPSGTAPEMPDALSGLLRSMILDARSNRPKTPPVPAEVPQDPN